MWVVMRRITRIATTLLLCLLAAYLCVAQPGMCPYWVVSDRALAAPAATADAGAPHHPHSHSQNREFFVTTTPPVVPQVVVTPTLLLALLAALGLKRFLPLTGLTKTDWRPSLLAPPPRCFASA